MTGETLVRVSGLHRHYGNVHAVRGVSFELRRGEVLGLLGPNGAGKTSTMNVVAGALAPSAGSVSIGGADLLERPMAAKRLVGYLPEAPPLHLDLTVDEFLDFCGRLRGLRGPALREARESAKSRTGLEGCGRRLIANLSKGYRQRVGIAQAVVHRPPVLILDEPTVGLDPIQIREIRALVRHLGEEHGVILSTHILPEVQAVCDRVQVLHLGRTVLDESIESLGGGEPVLRVTLARPPAPALLSEVPGVRGVRDLGPGRFRLQVADPGATAERLAAAAVSGDWGLREMAPETRTLEEVFVALTTGDAAPEGPEERAC